MGEPPHVPPVRRILSACLLHLIGACLAAAAPMHVSALHPLMADLARQVGGERVQVFDLMGESGDPHRYEPRPADMARLRESTLVLAAGKNLEPYLGRLRDTLGGVTVLEVGDAIPSLVVGKDEVYACCPDHAHDGSLDPHWWHGISNMARAARVVAEAFAEKDPAGGDFYQKNARAYGKRLDELKRWARTELAKVPRGQRKLVTAHNAFGYFAREFGFEVIAVAGLNEEQDTAPQQLAQTIASVRASGVKAAFPEINSSARPLEAVAKATGVKIAEPLIADGNGREAEAGFEGMIRHNVTAITRALAAP